MPNPFRINQAIEALFGERHFQRYKKHMLEQMHDSDEYWRDVSKRSEDGFRNLVLFVYDEGGQMVVCAAPPEDGNAAYKLEPLAALLESAVDSLPPEQIDRLRECLTGVIARIDFRRPSSTK